MHLRPSPFCQFLGAPPPFYCPALALRVSQLSQGLQPPQLGKSGDAPEERTARVSLCSMFVSLLKQESVNYPLMTP